MQSVHYIHVPYILGCILNFTVQDQLTNGQATSFDHCRSKPNKNILIQKVPVSYIIAGILVFWEKAPKGKLGNINQQT